MMIRLLIRKFANMDIVPEEFDTEDEAVDHVKVIFGNYPAGTEFYVVNPLQHFLCDEVPPGGEKVLMADDQIEAEQKRKHLEHEKKEAIAKARIDAEAEKAI